MGVWIIDAFSLKPHRLIPFPVKQVVGIIQLMPAFAENGTVLRGVIDEKVTLSINKDGYGFVDFKAGTILSFAEDGHLMHGTLNSDTYLRPVGWQAYSYSNKLAGFIQFKSGKAIDFNEKGEVISGTLKAPTLWHDESGSEITLPAKATVHFTEKGAKIIKPEKE